MFIVKTTNPKYYPNSRSMRNQLLSIALSASSLVTFAGSLNDTIPLHEVQFIQPGKTNIELIPLNSMRITAEQISRSTETSLLPVLVNKVPGLFVTERGMAGYGVSGGSAGTINIRGVGQGNKVLFMINGLPNWAGIYGHSLADTYTTTEVDHLEVVRGPSSLLYGSNAMGGSVNIITRDQDRNGFQGRARMMWGTHATQRYGISLGYRHNKFQATAGAQYDRSKNNRPGSDFWLANEVAQIRYNTSKNWNVGANINLTQSLARNPGATNEPLLSMWTHFFRGTAALYANNVYDRLKGGVQMYYSWGQHWVDDGYAPDAEPTDYIFRLSDFNRGFTAYETLNPWTGSDLSLGFDYKQYGGHAWNDLDKGGREEIIDRKETEVAGYLMLQQQLCEMMSVNAGVRLEHNTQFGNEWVPQAGFILHPALNNTVKFSFSKGYRAPNLRELYLYRPANPNLNPEYMYNYDVEIRQRLLDGHLDMGLSLFFIDGKDMIQTSTVDGRPLNGNTGSFINKGVEFDATYIINRQWNANANYSYLHTSKPLLAAPRNKFNAEVNYNPGQFEFTAEVQSIWGLYTNVTSGTKNDYTLLNLRAAYNVDIAGICDAKIFVKGDNLTNKHYEINEGFPMPGATVMAGFEVKF